MLKRRFRHIGRSKILALFGSMVVVYSIGVTAQTSRSNETIYTGDHRLMSGVDDDLITGGLGMPAILNGETHLTYASPLQPTAPELRRAMLVRPGNKNNGFGTLYGPNVDPATGQLIPGDAKVPGEEIMGYTRDSRNRQSNSMVVQIPASFSPEHSCLVVIATPGSQNVWADMQRAGYWGLRHGCALAWTDKGTGASVHDLDSDTVVKLDGTTTNANKKDKDVRLDAEVYRADVKAYKQQYPHRMAFKWANAGWNQEAAWGQSVLTAARFGLQTLENHRWPNGAKVNRANTTIIASGFSNGGGAVLRAAEQDGDNLLDGVVAMAPQVYTHADPDVVIDDRGTLWRGSARSSYDFLTYGNVYQACATLAVTNDPRASNLKFASNRCASLAQKGLLSGTTLEEQAKEALDKLHAFGFLRDSDIATGTSAAINQSVLGQASQFGHFTVSEHLCGLSFASVDAQGHPVAAAPALLAQLFVREAGGTPDGKEVTLINDRNVGEPIADSQSVSASTGRQDYDLDAALCLRSLFTDATPDARRVRAGIEALSASNDLHHKPVIVVQGRSDEVEGPNFTGRPYVATNSLKERDQSQLRYIEVVNGMHGEGQISAPGFDVQMVPVSAYQIGALEAMYTHLVAGKALPPSQVVHTGSRGGEPGHAPPLTSSALPPISANPAPESLITVKNGRMKIPS